MFSLWSQPQAGPWASNPLALFDPRYYSHHQPLSRLNGGLGSGIAEVHVDKHHFQVKMDVQAFSPDELLVKTVDDFLVIEGTHEEKEDEHGYVSRSFKRKYLLPPNTDKDEVSCEISKDGQLKVTVKRHSPAIEGEKVHAIKQTGEQAEAVKCCQASKCGMGDKC